MSMYDPIINAIYRAAQRLSGGINGKLAKKADLVNGTIPASQIPPEVFERMKVVADDTARYALTTADVQNGDIVYVNSSQIMYYVFDDTQLSSADGYKEFAAGVAAKAIADKNGADIATEYAKKLLTGYEAETTPTAMQTIAATDTVVEGFEKLDNNIRVNETNISLIQQTIGDINSVLEEVL